MPRHALRRASAQLLAALGHFDRGGDQPDPVTQRFQEIFDQIDACPDLRNASHLLARALKANAGGAPLPAPPGWLPPLL